MSGNVFVFRPGGAGGVFANWLSLVGAMSGVEGRKIIEFDDSLGPCVIPAGTWPMKDVVWAGFGPDHGKPRTTVVISSGAVFTNLRMIGGQITIVNQANSPDPSPVSDFVDPLHPEHVQIGLRDDCGNTQLVNSGDVPMFDLGNKSALFFLQNCLFGIPTPEAPMPKPLIRQKKGSQLILNLLGQNQTGPNLVVSEDGASVLFGALSSAAQVAWDQTSITNSGGSYRFGPQGRIQRWVIPRPPDPPAIESQLFSTPNVLIRCNGKPPGFTQDLPKIQGGFKIGLGNVELYTGGQEVVVAEVEGGTKLKVRPTGGDTIDRSMNPVPIHRHGSRTFVSDGVSNWITISEVGAP